MIKLKQNDKYSHVLFVARLSAFSPNDRRVHSIFSAVLTMHPPNREIKILQWRSIGRNAVAHAGSSTPAGRYPLGIVGGRP